ncbi:V-type proton ATPase subunit G [Colletotrichum orbiculare MAFF 240422]|uniref:V-type proton ATPase subunit G n=1 Tax=Colletotrichum orbiculare (strain 104-T / ATCC 96160 / CBS 514.97 / LARS 414 / MAFF 240422) TaxID=1213857 RepID=A0A484FTQ8_COLOR|nr:V-type proton ATPase subunit G [Colletotrichum orbiculare MAFF 240422]
MYPSVIVEPSNPEEHHLRLLIVDLLQNNSRNVGTEFGGYSNPSGRGTRGFQNSREYRTKRVKEARDEAKKEIEVYRNSKEAEFKKFESEHTQGNKEAENEATEEAEAVFEVKPVAPSAA